ncbi:MAG: SDR family NAD(P)-dependent oxidoreductase [Propionicimonas sp.]
MSKFHGYKVVITGSAEGIGRSIAHRFAEEGASLVLADFGDLAETARGCRERGAEVHQVTVDVRDPEAVDALAAAVLDIHGGEVDVLINNAGINGLTMLVEDMDLASWSNTLQTNLTGTMLVSKAMIPLLKKSKVGGRIVTTASNVGKRGLPYRADYVASKWAIIGFTQTLALELAPGIRVNAVCPGPVEGDRIEWVMERHAEAEGKTVAEIRAQWEAEAPLKRFVAPEEIAAAVAFLASDESSAMTGQAMNVTGGLIMS